MARPRGTGGKARYLTLEERERVFAAVAGTRHEERNLAFFKFSLGTGLRAGEAISLRLEDVYFQGKILDEFSIDRTRTKGNKSRRIYLSNQAVTALERWLVWREGQWPDCPYRGISDPKAWLFPSPRTPAKPLSIQAVTEICKNVFEEAGIKGAKSHSFRRSFATDLYRAGVDIVVIQHLLGHANIKTTRDYLELDPLKAKFAVQNYLR